MHPLSLQLQPSGWLLRRFGNTPLSRENTLFILPTGRLCSLFSGFFSCHLLPRPGLCRHSLLDNVLFRQTPCPSCRVRSVCASFAACFVYSRGLVWVQKKKTGNGSLPTMRERTFRRQPYCPSFSLRLLSHNARFMLSVSRTLLSRGVASFAHLLVF